MAAPVITGPIADLFNMSLESAYAPTQWKRASILPIPKINSPAHHADFRPISIAPVLSRLMERIIVRDYIYPSFLDPPDDLVFTDQFAFRPTASTTATLISPFTT
jgi:hypothetical protein